MSTLNYLNYPLNEKEKQEIMNIENNFNLKVSSLGDIYSSLLKNEKKNKNENNLENIDTKNISKKNDYFSHYIKNKNNILIKRNKIIKNQSFNHTNKIIDISNNNTFNEIDRKKFNNDSFKNLEINNSRKLNINILHPVPLKKSNKFHHIKGGKINPVRLNFNVKNIIMNNIKEHENSMQQIKIYSNKVNIDNSENNNKTLKRNYSNYNDFSQNFKTDKMMVIGQSFDPKNKRLNESHVSMSYSLPQKNNLNNNNNNINKNSDYFYNNFEIRKTLEKGELLTKTINDYFYYNDKKINNKYSIKTIVKYAKDLEKNLDNFETKISNMSKSKKKYLNKNKKKNKKFLPIKKKIYLEFDKNYIKQIQEKLSIIHLELRQICDNISLLKENNKDENKIKNLIEKTKNMNQLLYKLAEEIKIEEKKLNESSINHNNVLNKSLSYSKLNNTVTGFKSTLKHTSFNPIVESLNFSTKKSNNNSFNLNNSKNNLNSNLNKSKSFTNIKKKEKNNVINKENLINNNNYLLSTKDQTLFNNNTNNNISKNNTLSNFMNTNNFNDINNSDISNKSMLSTFKYSFNNPKKIDLNNKTQTNIFYNSNNLDNTNLINNPFIKSSLNKTLFKPNIPKNNLTLSQSVINDQSKVINQLDFSPEDIKLDTNPLKIIKDERFSSYNIEYPPQYYYEIIKQNEPLKNKDWFIRPHHIESISNSKKAINDDVLNTKYISYYGKPEINENINNKNREEILADLINETKNNIDNLKNEMYNKSKLNTKNKKLYNELQNLKSEAKKNFIPGKVFEKEEKIKELEEMIKDPNTLEDLNEMLAKKSGIQEHNFTIDKLEKILDELRNKEKEIINKKRMEELKRMGPPQKKWYNLKGKIFNQEFLKNELMINSGLEYSDKIKDLNDKDLY